MNTLFNNEDKEDKLRTLAIGTTRKRKTKLKNQQAYCQVNVNSSWFIGCDGKMVPLERITNRTRDIFRLQWLSRGSAYYIWVVELEPVDIFRGRVINLGISCSNPPSNTKEGCLLFKLQGSFSCPVERPTGPIFSSTLNPTTSTLEVKSKSTTRLGTATRVSISPTQAYSEKATVSTTISPTQAITQPSSGRRQKNEDDSSSSPLGVIAGVTVSITLVLVVIAALFIYRRRKSRKDGHKSTSGHTNKNTVTSKQMTNSAFKLEEQNGFVKNNGIEPFESIYAPNYVAPQQQVRHGTLRNQQTISSEENSQSGGLYAVHNIPDGHTIFGPRDSQEEMSQNNGLSGIDQPLYNILEDLSVKNSEETVNNGSNAPEPVYNVLEEPYAEGSEGPAWYGSVPVEGPVYNTLEEPYAEGSEGPAWYGSVPVEGPVNNTLEEPYAEGSEGPAWYGSVPVDGPVYNTLQEPNQYAGSPSTNYEPVYNVLEAPDHGGAGEADSCGPSGVQDPVYNVLEGPDPDKSSGDGLYSNSLEAQDPGSCNNIPVYAVVNKKKK